MFSSLPLAREFSRRRSVSIDGDFTTLIVWGAFPPLSRSTCGGDGGLARRHLINQGSGLILLTVSVTGGLTNPYLMLGSHGFGSMAGVFVHNDGQADVADHGLDLLLLCDVGGKGGGVVAAMDGAGMNVGLWSLFQGVGTPTVWLGRGGSGEDEEKAATLVSFLAPLGFGMVWAWVGLGRVPLYWALTFEIGCGFCLAEAVAVEMAKEVAEWVNSTSAIVPALF